MPHSPSVYAAILPHGYGHGAITLPVIEALARRYPALRLAVVGGPPQTWVEQRLSVPLTLHDRHIADLGMVNADSNTVLPQESLARYRALFEDFEALLDAEIARQRRFRPDLVVSNVGFVPLAAAQGLGIPAIALAPFHWGQILGAYCQAPEILSRMHDIYAACDAFIQTTPFVPMLGLENTHPVGPICHTAPRRREALMRALGAAAAPHVALIAMGGIGGPLPVESWPRFSDWTFIACGPDTSAGHPDVIEGEVLPLSFTELVASVDVVITKPGYGTVTEAACAGTAILCRERNDWPETPHMMAWAERHVPLRMLSAEAYHSGAFHEKLQTLLHETRRRPAHPTGAEDAADILSRYV